MRPRTGPKVAIASVAVAIIVVALVAIVIGLVGRGSVPTRAAADPREFREPSWSAAPARIRYEVRATRGGIPEFCSNLVSPNVVILGHIHGCADELILMRPARVDCGPVHGRTSADALAAAILAQSGLRAKDLGTIRPGTNVPRELFRVAPVGRVIDIERWRDFADGAADPDQCQLIASVDDVGRTVRGTPAIELRGDLRARYLLFDGSGGLGVVAVSLGGHDQVSGRDGTDRGYGGGGLQAITHILDQVHDVTVQ